MAKGKITLTTLKKHLKQLPQDELVAEIAELFKRFPEVKDFYQVKLSAGDDSAIAEKYKKVIENEFFPARGFGKARLSVGKKAITDYKKVCSTMSGLIDMMLFYVEQGVQFTVEYGDIDEPFYNSMESVYDKALALIVQSSLHEQFYQRCSQVVSQTSGMGWGFHDALSSMFYKAFADYE
ncbi:MAG: DUF6155 family protein [Cyanobacteria bacterium P01_F01_bin.150]